MKTETVEKERLVATVTSISFQACHLAESSHELLNDSQSNSILRDTVGPEDAPIGFPSNLGPSRSLPSTDMALPSVLDGDIYELPDDNELLSNA